MVVNSENGANNAVLWERQNCNKVLLTELSVFLELARGG